MLIQIAEHNNTGLVRQLKTAKLTWLPKYRTAVKFEPATNAENQSLISSAVCHKLISHQFIESIISTEFLR